MAQKRMIDKKISVSEQVANLPLSAQLIFTWSIPHADDLGLLPISLRTLKAMIVPMWEITLEDFGNQVESIVSQGLWEVWEWEGDKFYRISKFLENQTLKKDRKPNTLAKNINDWGKVEDIGFQMEDNGNPSKDKLREVKRSKVKIIATAEELEKDFFENPLMAKIQAKYPDRDYKFYFDQMCEWYLKNKGRLPQTITAFTNWLDKTKPDEVIQKERLRKLAEEERKQNMQAVYETPPASEDKLNELRNKMKGIGKSV